jgi:hypothetical protein
MSSSDRDKDYAAGDKAGRKADEASKAVHAFLSFLCSDDYNEGFDHGAGQQD